MIILIPDNMNLAEFEEDMSREMFFKYFDVNSFTPPVDGAPMSEGFLYKENVVNLTLPLFSETYVNQHLDKSLLSVKLSSFCEKLSKEFDDIL